MMAPSPLWMSTITSSWCHFTPLLAMPLPGISAFAFWIPCRYFQHGPICVTPLLLSPKPIPLPRMLSYPIPIPNLINPLFFNIQFKVIPWIEYWRISQEEETTAYACLHINAFYAAIHVGFWRVQTVPHSHSITHSRAGPGAWRSSSNLP